MPMLGARSATTLSLSLAGMRGEGMRDVGAAHAVGAAVAAADLVQPREVGGARVAAALADALGDLADNGMERHGNSVDQLDFDARASALLPPVVTAGFWTSILSSGTPRPVSTSRTVSARRSASYSFIIGSPVVS